MSITGDLSRRLIQQSQQQFRDNSVAQGNDALAAEMASFEHLLDRHRRVTEAMRSVEDLTRMFFSQHRLGVPIEQAKMYEFSVESIIRATGEELPHDMHELSFESSYDYSTEAESKVGSSLKKVGAWLMEILTKIAEGLKGILTKFTTSVQGNKRKLEERLAQMRAKAGKKEGGEKDDKEPKPSTEAKGRAIEVPDIKILGGTGVRVENTIDKANANTRKGGQDLLGIVRACGEAAKRFNPSQHTSKDGLDDFMKDIMLSVGMKTDGGNGHREFIIVNGTGVEITFNRKSDATVSAKAGKIAYEKKAGEMPGLDEGEAMKLLEHLIESYSQIDSLRKPLDTVSTVFGQLAKSMNDAYRATLNSLAGADKDAADKAAQSSRVYSTLGHVMATLGQLPSNLLSGYLQVHYAADNYADKASRG